MFDLISKINVMQFFKLRLFRLLFILENLRYLKVEFCEKF